MIIKPYASIGKLLLSLWDAFDNVGKYYIFKCIYANLSYHIPKINKYITKFITFFSYNCVGLTLFRYVSFSVEDQVVTNVVSSSGGSKKVCPLNPAF